MKGQKAFQVKRVKTDFQDQEELLDPTVKKVLMVQKEIKASQVYLVHKEIQVFKAQRELQVNQVCQELQEIEVYQVNMVHQVMQSQKLVC